MWAVVLGKDYSPLIYRFNFGEEPVFDGEVVALLPLCVPRVCLNSSSLSGFVLSL